MKFITTYKLKSSAIVLLLAIACFVISFVGSSVRAETTSNEQAMIRVSTTTGSNTDDCGSEAGPCQTIQFAIQNRAADSGDTILVAAGTYTYDASSDICQRDLGTTGAICVVNKEVTLKGGYASGNWSDQDFAANETIIDGNSTLRGAMIASTGPNTTLTMDGFIIQNGFTQGIAIRPYPDNIAAFGGGMFVDSAQSVVLKDIIFRANRSVGNDTDDPMGGSGAGGGLSLRGTTANLEDVTFDGNQAIGGAGSQRGGYGTGGGIHTSAATVTGNNIRFINNISTGGNTAGNGADSNDNNLRGDALGAGASFQDDSVITVQNVLAQGNQATGGNGTEYSGGAFGAGVFVEKATATFTNLDLRENIARGGNAANAWLGRGGGAEFIDSQITINNVIVIGNQAIGGNGTSGRGSPSGGGLSATAFNAAYPSSLNLTNGLIAGNSVTLGEGSDTPGGGGAGLLVQGLDATIKHLTVVDNQLNSPGLYAPGIIVMDIGTEKGANADISHSIIADHGGPVGTIHVQTLSSLTLSNGLWSNFSTNSLKNDGNGNLSGTETMSEGDAGFADPANNDYRITEGSAAIDKATGSLMDQSDIVGTARSGSTPDLGAFELGAGSPSFSEQSGVAGTPDEQDSQGDTSDEQDSQGDTSDEQDSQDDTSDEQDSQDDTSDEQDSQDDTSDEQDSQDDTSDEQDSQDDTSDEQDSQDDTSDEQDSQDDTSDEQDSQDDTSDEQDSQDDTSEAPTPQDDTNPDKDPDVSDEPTALSVTEEPDLDVKLYLPVIIQ